MRPFRIVFVLLLCPLSWGQFVTITGTVKDPSGNAYAGGNGRVLLVSGNGSGSQSWSFSPGNNINPVVVITGLDSFGSFSTRLANTSLILPQAAQPKWQFQFCSQDGATCFTMTPMALTTSQDISATIQAQAAFLPGGGGVITSGTLGQIVDVSIPNDPGGSTSTAGVLAKWNGTNLVECTTADTTPVCLPVISVSTSSSTLCAPGTTGNGCWLQTGRGPCLFDPAGASGSSSTPHFVINSTTTNGRCMDAGTGYPNGSYIVGTINTTVASNQIGNVYVRSAFSQIPSGYAVWQNSAVDVAHRTKTNILGGFMTATDNAGNASTDLRLGVLGLPDGSDTAGAQSIFFSSHPNGSYFRYNSTANGFMFGYGGTPQWYVSNGGFDISPLAALYFSVDNTFAAQQMAIGVSSGGQFCVTKGSNPSSGATCDGVIRNAIYRLGGDTFTTNNGCGEGVGIAGGATGGKITTSGTTSCTTIVTFGNLGTFSAPNGWACTVHDITSAASYNNPHHTSSGTTVTIVSGTITSGDVLEFACWPY